MSTIQNTPHLSRAAQPKRTPVPQFAGNRPSAAKPNSVRFSGDFGDWVKNNPKKVIYSALGLVATLVGIDALVNTAQTNPDNMRSVIFNKRIPGVDHFNPHTKAPGQMVIKLPFLQDNLQFPTTTATVKDTFHSYSDDGVKINGNSTPGHPNAKEGVDVRVQFQLDPNNDYASYLTVLNKVVGSTAPTDQALTNESADFDNNPPELYKRLYFQEIRPRLLSDLSKLTLVYQTEEFHEARSPLSRALDEGHKEYKKRTVLDAKGEVLKDANEKIIKFIVGKNGNLVDQKGNVLYLVDKKSGDVLFPNPDGTINDKTGAVIPGVTQATIFVDNSNGKTLTVDKEGNIQGEVGFKLDKETLKVIGPDAKAVPGRVVSKKELLEGVPQEDPIVLWEVKPLREQVAHLGILINQVEVSGVDTPDFLTGLMKRRSELPSQTKNEMDKIGQYQEQAKATQKKIMIENTQNLEAKKGTVNAQIAGKQGELKQTEQSNNEILAEAEGTKNSEVAKKKGAAEALIASAEARKRAILAEANGYAAKTKNDAVGQAATIREPGLANAKVLEQRGKMLDQYGELLYKMQIETNAEKRKIIAEQVGLVIVPPGTNIDSTIFKIGDDLYTLPKDWKPGTGVTVTPPKPDQPQPDKK